MLSKILSSFLRKTNKNYSDLITPELANRIGTIYAYKLMMKSGDYHNEAAYQRNKEKNKEKYKEVLDFLCGLGYKLTK